MIDVGTLGAIQIWTLVSVVLQIIMFIICTGVISLVGYFAVKAVSLFMPRMLDDLIEKNVKTAGDALLEEYTGEIDDFLEDTIQKSVQTIMTSLKMSDLGKRSGTARSQKKVERELAVAMIKQMGGGWILQFAESLGLGDMALAYPEATATLAQTLMQQGMPMIQQMFQPQPPPQQAPPQETLPPEPEPPPPEPEPSEEKVTENEDATQK